MRAAFAKQDNAVYSILRPVMIYGAGDRGNLGRMIEAIRKNRFIIPGSGNNKKSAIFVEDVAEIVFKMLDNKAVDNKEFILSNLKVETLSSMTRIISRQLGKRFPVLRIPMVLLNIFAKIGDVLRMDKFNSKVLRKLTVDSDLSRYSNIQAALAYYDETPFAKALAKILKW